MNAKNIALKQAQECIQAARSAWCVIKAREYLAEALIYLRLAELEA